MKMFLFLCYFVHLMHEIETKFCGSVSVFDYVCTKFNNTVIVLSAKPCVSKTSVSLTIMRTGSSSFFYNIKTNKIIDDPIRIGNSSTGLFLEIHDYPSNILYEDRLHVKVRAVILDISGKVLYDLENIFEAYIPMHPSKCQESLLGDNIDKMKIETVSSDDGFMNSTFCDRSMRLGDFSTLCYISLKGIFLTVLDVCSVPYSITVLAIDAPHNVEVIKIFTAKKDDMLIPMNTPGKIGGDECGVKLTMFHSHGFSHEKHHVVLTYTCRDPSLMSENVINDSYFTTYGLVCPESNCEKSDVNKQNCTVNVISSEKTLQMTAEIILDKCHKTKTAAHVRIEIESFKQTYSAYLGWSDHFTIRQNANRSKFYLGSQNVMTSQSGYLPISGGEISLYVKEDSSVPALHVVVLRHYPEFTDAFPLVRSIFVHNGDELCSKVATKSDGSILVKTLVPIMCFLFILFVAVSVFLVRKRMKQTYNKHGDGLPYQIELGEDDDFEGFDTS